MADHDSKSQLEMASQLNEFATTLFQVVGKSSHGNISMSPFNVAALLSMVHAGAKGNTAKQLKEALGLGKFSEQEIHATIGNMMLIKCTQAQGDEDCVLKAANLCYVEDKLAIKKEFQAIMAMNFGALAKKVNFNDPKLRKKINSYVEKFTNKKIKDLLSKESIGQTTVMLLVNVIYFKGDWSEKFDPKLTQKKPFFLGSEKSKVDVKMMRLTRIFRTGKIDSLDAQFVELPYKGQKLSMIIILPYKVDGLATVESNLSGEVLDEMEKHATQKKICVELPKFKIETKIEEKLMDALSSIGIKDLFSGSADLSGVSDFPGLFASSIIQKCKIKVDEKGMEAAAATASNIIMASSVSPQVLSFKVNHPAIFIVKDDVTKLVLFVGRLANPAEK